MVIGIRYSTSRPLPNTDAYAEGGLQMDQIRQESCPHEPVTRAPRCIGCCEANGSLTPCVVAWLKDQVTGLSIVPLQMAEERSIQRAA